MCAVVKVERQKVGTVDVIRPVGPLVDQDVQPFARALMERLQAANPRVVIAMNDVPYMDSVALEQLLDGTDELADRAMNLKLAGVTPACREILEMTGLASRFSLFADVQDAVRSFL